MNRQSSFLLATVLGGLVALAASPGPPWPERNVTVEKVEYQGWKNNLRLSNGDVELIVTLDIGPRILSYRLANGKRRPQGVPRPNGAVGRGRVEDPGRPPPLVQARGPYPCLCAGQ